VRAGEIDCHRAAFGAAQQLSRNVKNHSGFDRQVKDETFTLGPEWREYAENTE
jgi:hypothetical protein